MDTISIRELMVEIHDNAQDKGFWTNTDIPTKLMLIVTEVAEAMEEYRISNNETYLLTLRYRLDGKPEGFPSELADIIIRILDLAQWLGLDMEELIREKMNYNSGREYLHGKTV